MTTLVIGGTVFSFGRTVKAFPDNRCALTVNGYVVLPGQTLCFDTDRPLEITSATEGSQATIN